MKEIKSYLKTALKLKAQPTIELNDLETLVAYIDQQDQIIREAREYVKENVYLEDNSCGDEWWEIADKEELLEILDRNVK